MARISLLLVILMASVGMLHLAGAVPQTPAPMPQGLADALTKLNAGDFAGALALAESVAKEDPKNARAWRVVGLAAIRTKRPARAVEAYTKAIELDPSFVANDYNLAV